MIERRHGEHPRLMLVEDDPLLGQMVEELLESQDYRVDRAVTVEGAMTAMRLAHFDLAVLDINLQDEPVFPVADRLAESGIPFIFVSGAHAHTLPRRHAGRPLLRKPFSLQELVVRLETLVD